jgi:Cysteine-rich CWC
MGRTLKNLDPLVAPSLREASACESCGGEFVCGATLAGCWCGEVKLSDETRAELRARFQSCLCRACLERFAAGEAEQSGREQKREP